MAEPRDDPQVDLRDAQRDANRVALKAEQKATG